MKKLYILVIYLTLCCSAEESLLALAAEEKGPVEITIQSTIDAEKISKPVFLPHQTHQWLECEGCHHRKGPDGKRVDYSAGQKIEKCEICHNSKAGMPEKVATLKRAGHALCMECHRKNDEQLTKCGVCHAKKMNR